MLQISNDHTTLVTKSELFLQLYFYKGFYFVTKIMKILSKLRYLTQGKGTLHSVQSTEVFPLFYIQVAAKLFSDILTLCFCNRINISTDTYTRYIFKQLSYAQVSQISSNHTTPISNKSYIFSHILIIKFILV